MSESYEHCMECGSLTGRAGRAEDSLYHGYIGPFCEDCFEDWPDEQVAQITTLRQQLTVTKAENEALRAQIKETEEKGRVLMDMCRDFKRRVGELGAENETLRGRVAMQADGIDAAIDYIGSFCAGFPRVSEMLDALSKVQVASAEEYRLRVQAEAVEEMATQPKRWEPGELFAYAQRLRNQTDEAERAGGEK